MQSNFFASIDELAPLFQDADYIDVKTIRSKRTLRDFLAGFLYYKPGWLKFLYRIRKVLVRLLGMRQQSVDDSPTTPEAISFTPGDSCPPFTVTHAKEDAFYAAMADDKHLQAHLLVAVEPTTEGSNRFHVGTIVRHKHWTGPVYFALIKPFHHLVAHCMMKSGAK